MSPVGCKQIVLAIRNGNGATVILARAGLKTIVVMAAGCALQASPHHMG
jgi:hypothetical protein